MGEAVGRDDAFDNAVRIGLGMLGRLIIDNAGRLIVGAVGAGAVGNRPQASNGGDDRHLPPPGLALVEDHRTDLARQRRKTKRAGRLNELVELPPHGVIGLGPHLLEQRADRADQLLQHIGIGAEEVEHALR